MDKRNYNSYIFLLALIPSILLGGCADNSKFSQKTLTEKPWFGVQIREVSEKMLKNLKTTVIIGNRQDRSMKKVYGWHSPDDHFRYKVDRYDEEGAWLGVSTEELTPQLREYFDVPGKFGLLISEVQKDSPAEKYGLKAGDIILMINRKKIKDHFDLVKTLDYFEPEDEVEIEITRDREVKSIQVTLGKIKRKHRFHLGIRPEKFQMNDPEIELDIPEIKIDIPDFDLEEIERLDEKIREELEINADKMTEKMEELQEKLKDIEIKIDLEHSNII